ncbi:MAG: hypothetical protein ACYDBQ_03025 [Thermoplasmatota archaeon]
MRHKVSCVTMAPPANARDIAHPALLGTDDGRRWSTAEVVAALDAGEEFYTRRAATKADQAVFAFDCRLCGTRTIRSGPTEEHNRLERHPACR